MLLHLIMGFINTAFATFYAALPPWSITFGNGTGASSDGSVVHYVITYVVMWDRFLPIHDCMLPILGINLLIGVALTVMKVFFKGASFIPTINAGG